MIGTHLRCCTIKAHRVPPISRLFVRKCMATPVKATAWCWEASQRAVAWITDPQDVQPLSDRTPVMVVVSSTAEGVLAVLPPLARRWAEAVKWRAKSGEVLLVPGPEGNVERVLLGVDNPTDVWGYAALATKLPSMAGAQPADSQEVAALYDLDPLPGPDAGAAADAALLGWMLGCYKYDRYKSMPSGTKGNSKEAAAGQGSPKAGTRPLLVCPSGADRPRVEAMARAIYFARDLINTPANDMGPQHLAAEAAAMASHHSPMASCSVISGDDLLSQGWPAVHTVGRASSRPPALVDITWQPPAATTRDTSSASSAAASAAAAAALRPCLALVGKGVCFDTGGLNIKTAAGMKTMKKDMGGAALMLALSHVVMSWQLPVTLRVLVPAVENSISGDAYRPLDVLQTRAGITVEQGNCDAEGRLILCDALFEAASSTPTPDLIIDAATLTGAARTALGPEIPAVFSSEDEAWRQLERAATQQNDPVWRLPLHEGYRRLLDSKVADMGSVGADAPGQAGAIVAALFLSEFVNAGAQAAATRGVAAATTSTEGEAAVDPASPAAMAAPVSAPAWLHIDTGAWVAGGVVRPGRPEGGEALGLFALAAMLRERYSGASAGKHMK